ncbi:MAG: TylF/MycF/NovP-related O-methyltransferase [Bryobacteraceae bacterium]
MLVHGQQWHNRTAMKIVSRVVSTLVTSPLAYQFGTPVLHLTQYLLSLHRREVVNFDQLPARARAAKFIRRVLTMFRPMTMGVDEGYMIYSAVQSTAKIPGDVAEVGVFRGQSARIICEAKSNKVLHLFDTFEGLPEPGNVDTKFTLGEYACSLPEVQKLLADQPNVRYHPGLFPATAGAVAACRFSFVHLDVDLYESTRAALEFLSSYDSRCDHYLT